MDVQDSSGERIPSGVNAAASSTPIVIRCSAFAKAFSFIAIIAIAALVIAIVSLATQPDNQAAEDRLTQLIQSVNATLSQRISALSP